MFKKFAALALGFGMLLGSSASAADNDNSIRKIIINSASRLLSLYDGNVKIRIYPLGLGKPSTPTPVGYYKINTKEINPTWIDPSNPEYEVPSGESNPLGYRWMQIKGNYGIHGTNRPDSIGYYVSNGCIRMREADVESLFDLVEIGTPVEITYNRVVVEKTEDDNIAYYIYPDGYGWQPIDTAYVNQWLAPYGVAAFESDEDIQQKIHDSNGEPTYIGKAYPIEINGQRLDTWDQNGRTFDSKAVVRSGITYLPAVPIAMAIKTKLEWRAGAATLRTAYGEVVGFEKKKQIYVNADDAIVLFNLDGGLQSALTADGLKGQGKVFRMQTVKPVPPPVEETKDKDKKKSKDKDKDKDKKTSEGKSDKDKKKDAADKQPSEEKPAVEEKPVEEKPVEEKPVDEKPSEDKAAEDKAVEDKDAKVEAGA